MDSIKQNAYSAKDIITLSPGRASKNSIKEIGKIYIIKNNINNKVYIGQTINSLSYRFNQHARVPLKKCSKDSIDYAIQTLGKEHFSIELLEQCYSSKLDEREIYWINFYNSFYNGYNLTLGGRFQKNNKISEQIINRIIKDYQDGVLIKDICKKYDISTSTLYRHLHNNNIDLSDRNKDVFINQSIKNLKLATEKRKVKIHNKTLNKYYDSKKTALIDMINIGYSHAKDWHNIRTPLDKALKTNSSFLNCYWEVCYE